MPESRDIKKIYQHWGGSTAAFFIYTHLSHDLCTGLLPALISLIKVGLDINYLQTGLLLTAFTITSGISQVVGGWLGDRVRRSSAMVIGLGGVSLAALAAGLSPSYYPLLIILILMGIFSGAYHPSAISYISGRYGEDKRGKVLALHMVGGSIGYSLGPVIGGLIAVAMGWNYAYIFLCVPTLIAAVTVFFRFRSRDGSGYDERNIGIDGQPLAERAGLLEAIKPIALLTALGIMTQFAAGSAMAFLPLYLVDKHGVTSAASAMYMSVVRVGGAAGSLFGGWLSDRWTRKNAIMIALAATGPVLYLLTLLPFNAAAILMLALFGMFMYMRQATIQPYLMDGVPAYLRSTVFGIYFGLSMEGRSLMQPVVGHFMDVFGSIGVFTVIAYISIGISILSFFVIRSPGVRRSQKSVLFRV